MTTTSLRSIACIVVLTAAASASAQTWEQRQRIVAEDGSPGDAFGVSVALSGDTALVGAVSDDDLGDQSGSAYVFERIDGAWTQVEKLNAADGAVDDEFGFSVAFSGDTALVGARGNDDNGTNSGAAYVFQNSNGVWTQTAKLTASDGAANDDFGSSVFLSGDTALVGMPGGGDGAAYVFENINEVWTQTAKLTAANRTERLGGSVCVSGDVALVGAVEDGDATGAAYVFEKINGIWTQAGKLTAADGAEGDMFGSSVAVSGDTALVGALHTDSTGSAYVFKRVNGVWAQSAKLAASDRAAGDEFGFSLSLSADVAVVGARGDDDHGNYSGSAYVFLNINSVWTQTAKLSASDGAAYDYFGWSVAISGDTALVGAIDSDNENGPYAGSVYLFDRVSACTGQERISWAACADRNGSNFLKVVVADGVVGDFFTVSLSTGETKFGTINSRGKGKARFKRVPTGEGVATAEWGCGATAEKPYSCP